MKSDIDWSQQPEPWCRIGPQFRAQVERIVASRAALPPTPYEGRRDKPERKHRDAVPSDPEYQAAKIEREAARAAEITAAKASLQLKHDMRAAGVVRNAPGRYTRQERYFEDDDTDEAAQAIVRAASGMVDE